MLIYSSKNFHESTITKYRFNEFLSRFYVDNYKKQLINRGQNMSQVFNLDVFNLYEFTSFLGDTKIIDTPVFICHANTIF